MGKRDDILDTALALFNRHGYHAVGVDLIRDEAHVSKMTLYKYFATKELLVEEVLKQRHERFRQSLELAVSKVSDPVGRFREVFNWHIRWFLSRQFHGCMFIKATGEFQHTAQYQNVSRQHKNWVRCLIKALLVEAGIKAADQKASHAQVVLDGMLVSASIFGSLDHVDAAWFCICDCVGIEHVALDKPDLSTLADSPF